MTIGSGGPFDELKKFGDRFRGWLSDLLNLSAIRTAFNIVPGGSLWLTVIQRIDKAGQWGLAHPLPFSQSVGAFFQTLITGNTPATEDLAPTLQQLQNDPALFMEAVLNITFSDPKFRSALEQIGGTIYDSSIAAITGGAAPINSEGAQNARSLIGFVTAISGLASLAGIQSEAESGGLMKTVGSNIQQVYWNLGLGFLTWQAIAPFLQGAILEPLTRDVQTIYRGARFTLAQVEDLFALGRITRDQLTTELIQLGWRDQDIEQVITLAYNKLSRSDIIDLWHNGRFSDGEVAARLRGLGYAPDDVELILSLEVKNDVAADKAESVSILQSAFEKGLISQDQFIEQLSRQGYTLNEIDLRIGLIRLKQQTTQKELSVGQLKQAWSNNVILDEEAVHHLMELGYAESETATILNTWKAEIAPKFLQVNQSNVLEAYRFGILDRRVTLEQLGNIGYSPEAATTLVEITEAKYPEAFGGSPPRKQRLLSLGAITDLFAVGRVSENDVLSWASQAGYSEKDAQDLLFLIKLHAQGSSRPLSQATIESAYATGVFTRDQALGALEQLGFTPQDAETEITVFEKKNAATFAPETVTSVRQPSITVLVKAYQSGFIDQTEFFNRATAIGYTKEAAQIYLETANTKQVKGTKALTKAEITEAYKKNMFDYSTARAELEDLGYSSENADLLLRLEQKGVTSTDVWTSLLQGWIDPQSALTALLGLGFTIDEVNAAIDALNAASG